ncbi:hypothetical protein XENTR_v10020211 [Xenopus tropicalis]|nr:hypothetical protein XENTR_v10020211 [Xenopus tropicalis]
MVQCVGVKAPPSSMTNARSKPLGPPPPPVSSFLSSLCRLPTPPVQVYVRLLIFLRTHVSLPCLESEQITRSQM